MQLRLIGAWMLLIAARTDHFFDPLAEFQAPNGFQSALDVVAILQLFTAIVASAIGVLSSVTMLVLLAASLANAKPANIQQAKWMALGIGLVQLLSLITAIWLMTRDKHWYAAAAGIFPLVAVLTLVIVLVRIEW